jgi:hypothetical protein
MLVAHPGKLVTREEIRKKLWPNDTVVDFDQGINTAIRKPAKPAVTRRRSRSTSKPWPVAGTA